MLVRRSALRASDADRESIAERLRDAAAEGRLEAHELEHRLEVAFTARTYGQLSALVSDLPREQLNGRRRIPLRLRPATVLALVFLFPIALALALAALVAIAALLVAWATAVSLIALFLGPRVRTIGGPWAVGCRAWSRRYRRADSRAIAGFIPWL